MTRSIVRNKLLYRAIIWIMLLLSLYLLARLAPVLTQRENILADDFVQYWSGGKLVLQGENPFDPTLIQHVRNQIGDFLSENGPTSIILTPPWAITTILPFCVLDYSISRLAWLLVSAFVILISSALLWRLYSGSSNKHWVAFLIALIFAPTISVLSKGQITVLILLGLCGFLYFTNINRNDWMAGVCLALVSSKPQVVFLFWVAFLLWVIHQRRWVIILSTAGTIVTLSLIIAIFNPHIFQQYFIMLRTYQISDWANPTIGAYLRLFWLGIDKFWLQFLPALICAIGLVFYWYNHRNSWRWLDELPLLLFISQIASPYTWTYDQVILIPAIIQGSIWMIRDWKRVTTIILAITFLTINILDLLLHRKLNDFWFLWLAPVFFIWYLIIRWQYPISRMKSDLYTPAAG